MKRTIGALLFGIATLAVVASHAQQQPPATIRTGITSVPIDVRVVDRHGKPVTDLKQGDFTILEEGVPQAIQHFSTQAFTADPSAALDEPAFRTAASKPELAAHNRRIFLIVFGRGRHQSAFKFIDGLMDFLEHRALPQDQIALFAWNRATAFTTNRGAVMRTVARYRDRHEKIEADLKEWFSGLRAVYGSKEIPAHIQRDIDAVFEDADGLRARPVVPGQIAEERQIDDKNRRIADDLVRQALQADRVAAGTPSLTDLVAEGTAEAFDMSFDEYAAKSTETLQDVGNLYASIAYLRYLEGEKHLVFITGSGVALPDQSQNVTLARAASDARIAIDVIQTGGTIGAAPPRIVMGNIMMEPVARPAQAFAQTFASLDLRLMADLTGGQASLFQTARDAFRRLGESIEFQYLLGYYPSNKTRDGKYRKVAVKVDRPDVRVLYRQGYFAANQLIPLDRRQFITFNRIDSAARYSRPIDHVKLTVTEATVSGSGTDRAVVVPVHVDLARVKFTRTGDLNVASLDVAVYCGDAKDNVVCQTRQKVDLKLTDARLQVLLKDGTSFTSRVPASGQPRTVKVVVYDYGADLVGTAVAKVR